MLHTVQIRDCFTDDAQGPL